jgi:hypothetical protein
VADNAELDIVFEWNLRENIRGQRAIMFRRAWAGTLSVMPLVIAAAGVAFAIYRSTHDDDDWLTPALVVMVLVIIGEWVMLSGRFLWSAKQQQRSDRNLRFPLHHAFHDYGLTMRGRGSEFTLGWQMMERIIETREFILFFINRTNAYYLPKRAIGADLARLRAMIQAHAVGGVDIQDPGSQ